ncbi:YhgE/Pip domain-containing protein [Paenibacillus sp. JX-17]|uniref:YhgE/Pip domain-containing protein n=1 Tax=Paenibacillus lacisoli TaxID=3064525 RepID=A0ABT9CD42_9BACL|nr:YhgE/Pip domain-containing protein [Paenibacillus sp. JX-17]MDO7907189.1 YhgE/Pip domain-containing protein [Paenibacillus sp. JX-17]
MKSLSVFFKDLGTAVKNPKVLIPIIAIMFIPIIYSGIYLAAFWDPYGHLDRLPIAVVNQDQGAELEGKQLHVGEDLVKELKDNKEFDWQFVSKDQARKGMKDNKYYMTITIPENFSTQATTLMDDEPKPAELVYEPNASYNFVASQIGNSAIKEIRAKVSSKVTEAYADSLLDQVSKLSDGIAKAGEGAGELHSGAGDLDEGAATLKENLAKLANGTLELKDGLSPLTKGVSELHSGASRLKQGSSDLSSGLGQLQAAGTKLAAGADQASEGSGKLVDGLQGSLDGAKKLNQGLVSSEAGSERLLVGLQSAEDGSAKLSAGLQSSEQGSAKLESGLASAADASGQVADGAKGVADGLKQLAQASPELAQNPAVQKLLQASEAVAQGSAKLHDGQQQLAQGAAALHDGQQQLVQGAAALHDGQQQLVQGAAALHDGQQQLVQGSSQLAAGQQQLVDGAKSLQSGQNQLSAGLKQFNAKLGEAAQGGQQLAQGAGQLDNGSSQLLAGVNKLSSGVTTLADGSVKLDDGAGKLKEGIDKINDGSNELAYKLNDAADRASINKTDAMVDMFADPVQTAENTSEKVPNYGTGLTPYFMSLGLFVGALISTIVLKVRESSVPEASGWNLFVSRTFAFGGMALFQSLILTTIILYGLGLEVQSVPLFYLYTFLVSLAFIFLVQMLVTWFDMPGRFIVILALTFQLATSGGTFPIELIPDWLKPLSPLLPMTHSILGYKSVISTGDYSVMWHQAGILAIYGGVSIVLTALYFLFKGKKNQKAQAAETAAV